MAVQVTQGSGTAFKTTVVEDVHVGHVHVDSSVLPSGAASEATLAGVLTDTQLRATAVPVSGPLTDTQLRAAAVPVSGPVTNTELRATPVPISGTVTANTGLAQPLTDTQLRATAVPVSGPLTDTELRATAVPVSGPLTDAQLRATGVPVVPAGAVADNAADTANPIKVGGRYSATAPTYDDGDLGNAQVDARGNMKVALRQPGADADISAGTGASDGLSSATVGLVTRAFGYFFNGTSWDRARGDVTNGLAVDVTRVPTALQTALDAIVANTSLFHPVDGETVAIGATAADSSDLPAGRVWLVPTVRCHIQIGADPTATTSTSPPLDANQSYYFDVAANDEVSVIRAAGEDDGTLYVSTESAIA